MAAGALDYSKELLAGPHATLADQLQNLAILHQLKSDEFDDHLLTLEQQAQTNALAVAQVSAWMQANGLVTESLDWLTGLPIPLLSQQPIQMALAQGYLQTGQWTALLNITDQGDWGDLEFLRLALVSRAWSELGATRAAEINWGAAMSDAADHLEAMTQLLQLAESWHLPKEQEAVLLQIVQEFPEEHWASQELQVLDLNSGNTLGLHQLYQVLNAKFPDEMTYKNNLAATALLLKIDVPQARQWAAEDYAKKPDDPYIASTYAFALHLQGWDRQGLAIMQKLPPSELGQPTVALYYGVLLAATGKTNQAISCLRLAQTDSHLLPEEKDLLSAALADGQRHQP